MLEKRGDAIKDRKKKISQEEKILRIEEKQGKKRQVEEEKW